MAAAQITLFLTTNLAISTPVRNALIAQGMTNCDDLLDFTDKNIQGITQRMIQPGGTMPGRGNQAGRANRGTNVSFTMEQNLRRACL